MSDILYIDADLIAYKCSAAAEERSIIATNPNGVEYSFKNRTAFKAAIPEDKRENYTILDVQTPEPVENVYRSVKVMAKNIAEKAGVSDYKLVMSGKTNFRDNIPLPTKYKSNRKDTIRPILLPDARQYLQHAMKAIVTDGIEADDYLSIVAYDGYWNNKTGRVIQATTDKDARQCSGWLFNWDKHTSPQLIQGSGFLSYEDGDVYGEGHMWLLYQLLHGDSSDGYALKDLANVKFGAKGAFDVLVKAKSIKEAYSLLYAKAKEWYPDIVEYVDHTGTTQKKDALEIIEMYWQCARMLRFHGDNLTFKEMMTNLKLI